MPVTVNTTVSRATAPSVTRGDVAPGQIFSYVDNAGKVSDKRYGAVGRNGRLLSLNMASGELASSPNADRAVKILGAYKLKVKFTGSEVVVDPADLVVPETAGVTKLRSQVADGEVFRVKGGDTMYVHLGVLNKGVEPKYCSLPLNGDPNNYGVKKLSGKNSNVEILGTVSIEATYLK